jgi:LCP family protein required for cell wall assembly
MAEDRSASVMPGSGAAAPRAANRPEPSAAPAETADPPLPRRPVQRAETADPAETVYRADPTDPTDTTDAADTTEPANPHEALPRHYRRIRATATAAATDPATGSAPAPPAAAAPGPGVTPTAVLRADPGPPPVDPERPAPPPLLDPARLDDLDDLDEPDTGHRRRLRLRTVLAGIAAMVVVLLVGGLVGMQVLSRRLLDDVERIPNVFGPINAAVRPEKPVGTEASLNFLIVGVDSHGRQASKTTESSDVIMLMHVAPDRRAASFVFLPRDSWVTVPGRGPSRISSAYTAGGPTLLVSTIEQLSALRIDHFAILDFAAFEDITDAVGGLDLRMRHATEGFPAGTNHLDGAGALRYLRQPADGPRGELDRVRRQQVVMKAMMAKASSMGVLTNPRETFSLLDSVARAVSVDDSLDDGQLRSLALSLRNLRPGSVTFITAPIGSVGQERGRSVIRLDTVRARSLWNALSKDAVAGYVRRYPGDVAGPNAQ